MDVEGLVGVDQGFTFEHASHDFDLWGRQSGEVCDGTFTDFSDFSPSISMGLGGLLISVWDFIYIHEKKGK